MRELRLRTVQLINLSAKVLSFDWCSCSNVAPFYFLWYKVVFRDMFLVAEKLQEHSYGIQLGYFDHQNKNYP